MRIGISKRGAAVVVSAIFSAFGAASPTAAQPADRAGEAVCVVYEHAGFKGDRLRLTEGQRFDRLRSWDDRISSVQVSPGCALRLGEDDGFAGRSLSFSEDAPYVGALWNDAASSIACGCDGADWRVDRRDGAPPERASAAACAVYDRRDFDGERLEMAPDQSLSRLRRWNDRISSARIARGCRLTISEDWNFSGAQETATADIRYFGAEWSNRASSLACACDDDWEGRAVDRGGPGAPPPALSRHGAACVVYEDEGFSGGWRAFEAGVEGRTLGRRLAGDVGSVRVAPGCVALVDVARPYKLWIEQDVAALQRSQGDRADAVSCFCPEGWAGSLR